MPVIRASLLAVLALISCALALDLARAQDPTTETGTTLHPGINLIGWTAEPTPTSQLFREIPQLEAVWAWDAELDDWIVAARGAPEWLGGLGRLTPGMGLRMQLSGDQPFHWQRSTEPTRGLVKLRTGWNLVAWSGADQTPIDDALKGIGWSLRNVHRWNPTTQQWSAWTSPERTAQLIASDNTDQEADDDTETPTIRRGEALWINVARAVNWLQPTDILPRLIFPGGASQKLQTRVREDLESTLAFFRDQYGIQAEPDFTVYVAKDVETLIQAYIDDGQDVDDAYEASTRALWSHAAGWAGGKIVVKQSGWRKGLPDDEIARGRYLITHEYFHILQYQMARRVDVRWLVEGTADWAEGEHQVIDGQRTQDDLRDSRSSQINTGTPTLRNTEKDNDQWEYTLGWLAINLLTADAGIDSWVEFWHRAPPIDSVAEPDWHSAFLNVFGTSVEDFYADFGAWQYATERKNIHIQGNLRAADGQPLADTGVWTCLLDDGRCVNRTGDRIDDRTDDRGAFAIIAPTEGSYGVHLDLDGCTIYFRNGRFTANRQERSAVRVQGDDVQLGPLTIPAELCAHQIKGSITKSDGQPLAATWVSACLEVNGNCAAWPGAPTDSDGAFAITVPVGGTYHLSFRLDGCTVHFGQGRLTSNRDDARLIQVAGRNVQLSQRHVPAGMCAYQITGSITQADDQPLADTWVEVCLEMDGDCAVRTSTRTNADGAFAITVPTDGRYRVWFNLNGCSIYFGSGGLTTTYSERSTVRIEGRGVQISPRQIPAGMCAHRIFGRIVDTNGAPLAEKTIWFRGSDGSSGGGWTDANGRFEFLVPSDGAYRLWFTLDGCAAYIGQEGLIGNFDNSLLIQVDGRDVQLSQQQVPPMLRLCGP